MQVNNEGNSLGAFFKMIDLIEDDISEMLEDENSELSGYECLIISFNSVYYTHLTLPKSDLV